MNSLQSALKVNMPGKKTNNNPRGTLKCICVMCEKNTHAHTEAALSGCTYLLGSYLNVQAKLTTGNRHITL